VISSQSHARLSTTVAGDRAVLVTIMEHDATRQHSLLFVGAQNGFLMVALEISSPRWTCSGEIEFCRIR
jgi:hypothetical protein